MRVHTVLFTQQTEVTGGDGPRTFYLVAPNDFVSQFPSPTTQLCRRKTASQTSVTDKRISFRMVPTWYYLVLVETEEKYYRWVPARKFR